MWPSQEQLASGPKVITCQIPRRLSAAPERQSQAAAPLSCSTLTGELSGTLKRGFLPAPEPDLPTQARSRGERLPAPSHQRRGSPEAEWPAVRELRGGYVCNFSAYYFDYILSG